MSKSSRAPKTKPTKQKYYSEEDEEDPLLNESYEDEGVDIDEITGILNKGNEKEAQKKQKEQEKKLSEDLKRKKLEEKLVKEETKAIKANDRDPQERALLMLKIEKRKALFPHQSASLNVTNTMTNEEIQNKIDEVDIRISNKNAMSMTRHMIDAVASGTEKFGPQLGYDFSGLAAYVHEDPVMIDIVNEMSLKYDSYKQFPVEIRFMFLFSGGALAIHRANTSKRVSQIAANLPSQNISDL